MLAHTHIRAQKQVRSIESILKALRMRRAMIKVGKTTSASAMIQIRIIIMIIIIVHIKKKTETAQVIESFDFI